MSKHVHSVLLRRHLPCCVACTFLFSLYVYSAYRFRILAPAYYVTQR